jgi:hypothetical protein
VIHRWNGRQRGACRARPLCSACWSEVLCGGCMGGTGGPINAFLDAFLGGVVIGCRDTERLRRPLVRAPRTGSRTNGARGPGGTRTA